MAITAMPLAAMTARHRHLFDDHDGHEKPRYGVEKEGYRMIRAPTVLLMRKFVSERLQPSLA